MKKLSSLKTLFSKFIFIITLLFATQKTFGQCGPYQVYESFGSNALPTQSGTWAATSMTYLGTPRTGQGALNFNGVNDAIRTPIISNPGILSFWYRRSSNSTAWTLNIQTSTNNSTWTTRGTISSVTTTYQQYTLNLGNLGLTNVYIRLIDARSSGTNERYVDDLSITSTVSTNNTILIHGTSCTPTLQAGVTYSIYDRGGVNDRYPDNQISAPIVITPPLGYSATINFTSLSTESGLDFLKLYNGATTNAPAFHTGSGWSGSTAPGSFSATNSSFSLTLDFTSDGSINSNGFVGTLTLPIIQYATTWVSANTGNSWWCQGETRNVTVTVKNSGSVSWVDNGTDDYNIGVKWNDDVNYVKVDAQNLAAGSTQTYTFTVTAPTSGPNNLTFDVVKENQFWFASNTNGVGPGNVTYSQTVNVNNVYPTVNAGPNIAVCEGSQVTLNGSSPNINPSFTSNNTTNGPIPDGGSSVPGILNRTITVTNTGVNANQLTSVTLDILHTYNSDLDLILIAPNGSYIYLSISNGGTGDNYTNTVFSPTGTTSITAGTSPFTGTYTPEEPFSNLTGSADGVWTLRVEDWAAGDVGTFNSWGINFTLTPITPTVSWSGPNSFTANTLNVTIPSALVNTNTYTLFSTYRNCTSTSLVNVTGRPAPTATISGTMSVCLNGSQPSVTVNNPSSLPVTVNYNINGGSNQTIDVNGNSSGSILASTNVVGNFTYNLVNVGYQSLPNCPANITGSAIVSVVQTQILSEPLSTITICEGEPLDLTVLATGISLSYQWYKDGSIIDPNNNPSAESPSLLVDNFTSTSSGQYYVTIGSACNTIVNSSVITVLVKDSPFSQANANSSVVCQGSNISLIGTTDIGTTFNWTGPNNFTSSQQSPLITNVTYNNEGTYNFTSTFNGCSTTSSIDIDINPTPSSLSITPTSVARCANQVANLLTATGGSATFTRKLGVNTTITSNNGITPFTVTSEGARIQYLITNSELVSLGLLPGASITSIAFKVMSQGNYPQNNFTIKMAQVLNTNLTNGYATSIVGQFETVYSTGQEPAPAPGWKIYGFTNSFLWTGYYNIVVEVCYENDNMTNFCNNCFGTQNSAVEFSQTSFNSVYGSFDNNTDMCSNTGNNLVSSKWRPNMKLGIFSPTLVTWSPFTGLFTDAAATQPYNGGVTNSVYTKTTSSMVYTASAGSCVASAQVPVSVTPLPGIPGTISGPTTVCAFSTVTYSITSMYDATSYSWVVPSGVSIQSGQGTTSITVGIGSSFTSGSISVSSVNSCGTGQPSVLSITSTGVNSPATPSRITGTTNVCSNYPTTPNPDGFSNNVLYSSASVAGATTYNWRVPSGVRIQAGQGTRNVLIQFGPNFTSGNIEVRAGNSCGVFSSYVTLAVTKTPPVPGVISGPTCVTNGTPLTYTISPVSGATSYEWMLPMGGSGSSSTTSITMTLSGFSSGSIQVRSVTPCGVSSWRTLNLIKGPDTPGQIAGSTLICPPLTTTYSITPVQGATSYNWLLPTGVTGTSTTSSITVSYPSNFSSGTIQVRSVSGSCTSAYSVLSINNCSIGRVSNQTNDSLIVSNNSTIKINNEVKLYPNPTGGDFIVEYTSNNVDQILIESFDMNGKLVNSEKHLVTKGLNKIPHNLIDVKTGMYMIRITDVNNRIINNTIVKQ